MARSQITQLLKKVTDTLERMLAEGKDRVAMVENLQEVERMREMVEEYSAQQADVEDLNA